MATYHKNMGEGANQESSKKDWGYQEGTDQDSDISAV